MKLRRQLRQCTCGAKHKGFAVGLLLRAAAACTCGSFAPLHLATFCGQERAISALLAAGADDTAFPLGSPPAPNPVRSSPEGEPSVAERRRVRWREHAADSLDAKSATAYDHAGARVRTPPRRVGAAAVELTRTCSRASVVSAEADGRTRSALGFIEARLHKLETRSTNQVGV